MLWVRNPRSGFPRRLPSAGAAVNVGILLIKSSNFSDKHHIKKPAPNGAGFLKQSVL